MFEVGLSSELQSMSHPDFQEGISAAIGKREPKWR